MKAGKTNFRDAPQNVEEVLYVSDVHCIIKFSTVEWSPDTKTQINEQAAIQNQSSHHKTLSQDSQIPLLIIKLFLPKPDST